MFDDRNRAPHRRPREHLRRWRPEAGLMTGCNIADYAHPTLTPARRTGPGIGLASYPSPAWMSRDAGSWRRSWNWRGRIIFIAGSVANRGDSNAPILTFAFRDRYQYAAIGPISIR